MHTSDERRVCMTVENMLLRVVIEVVEVVVVIQAILCKVWPPLPWMLKENIAAIRMQRAKVASDWSNRHTFICTYICT